MHTPNPIQICIRWCGEGSSQPLGIQTALAAGSDIRADLQEDYILEPGRRALIPTGWSIALPQGYEAQVRPRSGLALRHGVTVLNSPGTIDADYRGEIKIILINLGQEPYTIEPGERIAQLVVAPVVQVRWECVQELESTQRGEQGFGSTGKQ